MKSFYYIIIPLLLLTGCATPSSYTALNQSGSVPMRMQSDLYIPVGVDSSIAAESEDLARASFVPISEENRAREIYSQAVELRIKSDTLWYYLTLDPINHSVSEEDSINAIKTFNQGAEFIIQMTALNSNSRLTQAEIDLRHKEYVDQAIRLLEEAIVLNPFDVDTRYYIAQLYAIKARRLSDEGDHQKAIEVLEKLSRTEKGDHQIFSSLADNYFEVADYQAAALNFEKARLVLFETGKFTEYYAEHAEYSPDDMSILFLYSFYQGEAFTRNFDSQVALRVFDEARVYASSEDEQSAIDSWVQFINWDGGQIRSSFERDDVIKLDLAGENEAAEQGYLQLLPKLSMQTAIDEMEWRLSVVQYTLGKSDIAVERLMQLVSRTETDENRKPLEENYARYFNDYGLICYNLGQEYLRQQDRATALKYFRQSSTVGWSNRAKANLEIANIIVNNVPDALRFAEQAEAEIQQLNPEERKALYSMLNTLHRRLGNMESAALYFEKWRSQ
jgi:tetratricopeptide (TPR) repeat protein